MTTVACAGTVPAWLSQRYARDVTMMFVTRPGNLLAVGIAVLSCRRQLGLVGAWAAGERVAPGAPEVAAAAHALPARLFPITGASALLTSLPLGVLATLTEIDRLNPADFVLLCGAGP